jgi:hypothetical protein
MSAHQGLVLTLPDELVDELVERVASRLARPTAEPWVGVDVVASHLGCRRQRIYDLVSQRGRGGGIPYRKDGSRLLSRLSEIDAWLTPPRRWGTFGSSRLQTRRSRWLRASPRRWSAPTRPASTDEGNTYTYTYRVEGRQRWGTASTLAAARKAKADADRGLIVHTENIKFGDYARYCIKTYQGRTFSGFRE